MVVEVRLLYHSTAISVYICEGLFNSALLISGKLVSPAKAQIGKKSAFT